MPLKRAAIRTPPNPQVPESEEEQNSPPVDPHSAGDVNPTDPEMEIDPTQIIGQVMAAIEATIKEEIGRQGTKEPSQEHPAPSVSLLPLNLLIFDGFWVVFYLK